MSRLFDALKGAKGSRQGAGGKPGDEVWDALGIDDSDQPLALNDPDVMPGETHTPVLTEGFGPVFTEDTFVEGVAVEAEPAGAHLTEISLSDRARLIPNAAEPAISDHYRRLRTKIMQQQEQKSFRSLVVTSANPQEGKTVTVLNLALSFAMLPNFKVLVVDGDLRTGTLGGSLGVRDHLGLSDLINGSAVLEDVLLRSTEIPMHFMVRGMSRVSDIDASGLDIHFQRMTELYDMVLVDTPPVNLIADAQLFAASCDAVLLVARAFSTTRKTLERAVQDLKRFRVIGTVLNGGSGQPYRHRYY